MADDEILFVPWDAFLPRFRWKQGEHVAAVGPTGQGKTTAMLGILHKREWTIVVATKPKDSTLNGLVRNERYVRIPAWPPPNADTRRVLLWPPWKDDRDTPKQSEALAHAIRSIFRSGGWTLFVDDVQYLTDELNLGRRLRTLWTQARSLGVSVVAATQRPRHVPLLMWSQSTHVFIWGTNDEEDLRRIGGLGGLSAKRIRQTVAELPKYHVLYINTRERRMAITKAPKR